MDIAHGRLFDAQREHWTRTYRDHPGMYGSMPSEAAVYAADLFRASGAREIVELGCGHGRDTLHFARAGMRVHALDVSETAVQQLTAAAHAAGVGGLVDAGVHDAHDPLPLPDDSVDAVYAHMLLCMAFTTRQIEAIAAEAARVVRPGGTFVYTVRHVGDAHHGAGLFHGDGIYEHGGFAVHFFDLALVDDVAAGWDLREVHAFEEGDLPRRLWRVTQVLRP